MSATAADRARLWPDRNFSLAIRALREFTASPAERCVFEVLVRAAVLSPAVAELLVKAPLRTKPERRSAVVAAATAMAAEIDADAGAVS
jgi:hypothetical protein